jgi:DNA-binding MarR family transcriptional regulator
MGRVKSILRKDRVVATKPAKTKGRAKETKLVETRRHSLGRRLYNLYRIYDSIVLEGIHAAGFADIRPVHTDILRSVDVDGTRLTDVATSCNITKQAASQLVTELVGLGYFSLVTAPQDTRVRMVVFTDRGMDLVLHLGNIFTRINRRLSAIAGEDKFKRFGEILDRMIEGFEPSH